MMNTGNNKITAYVRIAMLTVLGAWLCICLWGWFFSGSDSCGFMYRSIGFCTWGVGLCLSPLLLIAPVVDNETTPSLRAPLPFYKLIPLLLHGGLLIFLATDVPSNKSGDGEIIAIAGILAALVINASTIALTMLLYLLRKMYTALRKK